MNRNNNTRLFRSIMSSRDDGRRRIGFLQLCLYRAYSDWRAILLEEWPMDGPRKSPRAATDPFQALPSGCHFVTRPYGVSADLPRLLVRRDFRKAMYKLRF